MSTAQRLYATDETFREVVDLVYGGGVDPDLISKANPDGADLNAKKAKRKRIEAGIGAGSNAVGLAAGAATAPAVLGDVGRKRREYKATKGDAPKHRGVKASHLKKITPPKGSKTALALAGGAAGLHVGNIGGDAIATRILTEQAKDPNKVKKDYETPKQKATRVAAKKVKEHHEKGTFRDAACKGKKGVGKLKVVAVEPVMDKVGKARAPKPGSFRRIKIDANRTMNNLDETLNQTQKTMKTSRRAIAGVGAAGAAGAGAGAYAGTKEATPKIREKIGKAEPEIVWEGEFSKMDEDRRQVFGWATIVKKDGQDVVDLQGDYISIEEIEKSAYEYVVKSRKGGNQHKRAGAEPFHAADMIESFIVTPEKVEKMGLPEDTPLGWWVGFKVNDEDTWQQVKSGERTGFSIHGRGIREPV